MTKTLNTLILNIALGLVVFILNCVAFLFLNLSRTLPAKQKVILSSLTVTDAILGLQTMIITGTTIFNYHSDYIPCPIRLYSGLIIAYVTMFSNLLITVERFLSLTFPYLTTITWQKLCVCAFCFWIIAAIICYASFIDSFTDGSRCMMFLVGNPCGYLIFGIFVLIIFTAIIIVYYYIAKVTRRHIRQIASTMVSEAAENDGRRYLNKAELRSTVTVGIIIGCFTVSYVPLGVYCIFISLFVGDIESFLTKNKIFGIIMHFYLVNSLANPIVYIWRLKNCRKELIARILRRNTVATETHVSVINLNE